MSGSIKFLSQISLLIVGIMALTPSAFAGASDDMLHKALSDSFNQKAEVQKSYKEVVPGHQMKDEPAAGKEKSIAIDMGDELGASSVREKESGLEFRDRSGAPTSAGDDRKEVKEMDKQYKEAFSGETERLKKLKHRHKKHHKN